tara:strand:+ start:8973 stop:9359 length:387 start_codon:yes stop_codon:yes gene_type:complete
MKYEYGQALKLRDDIQLKFYVDGIYPAGQMGYKEPHYKILFDEASLIIAESLAGILFEKKILEEVIERAETPQTKEPEETQVPLNKGPLKKMNKDDLIAMAAQIDSSKDLTKFKKSELIDLIEESESI